MPSLLATIARNGPTVIFTLLHRQLSSNAKIGNFFLQASGLQSNGAEARNSPKNFEPYP